MSYTKRAVKGTVIVFLVNIISAFIGYVIRLVLARELTPLEIGLFFSAFTLVNLIAILKYLGLGQALIKYLPEFQVKKKPELISTAITTAFIFSMLLSLIFALVLFFLSNVLAQYYFKNDSAAFLLKLFALILVLMVFKDTMRSVFNGLQRMIPFSLMYLLENLLILIFVLWLAKYSLKGVMVAYILVYILVAILFFPLLSRLTGLLKKKAVFSKELLKKMLKFGVPLTFGGLGGIILLYTDTLVLTYFRSLEEVGIYNVVVPTAMMLAFFAIAISQVIFPMGSELWARGMKKMLAKGIEILQKYSFLIIIPCALAMFSFSELILRLLFGEAYVSGSLALQILVIGIIFLVIGSINLTLIESFGKPVIGANILLIGAAVNFLLNLLLIPKFGMIGAASTSLLGYFIIFLLSTIMLKKLIETSFPWLALIKIVIASAVFLFAIFYLKSILSLNAYLEAGVCLAMASIVYLALLLVLRVISIKEIKELYS